LRRAEIAIHRHIVARIRSAMRGSRQGRRITATSRMATKWGP